MNRKLKLVVITVCVIACAAKEGVKADKNGKSYAVEGVGETADGNASSVEQDSHEAMNNRQNSREKRSYEFLIGLVNNNSKYEVTRNDPTTTTMSPEGGEGDVPASDVLLELMVKLATHPQEWEKVHKLLQKLDSDLVSSKKVVDDIERTEQHPNADTLNADKRHKNFEEAIPETPANEQTIKNGTKKHDFNEWPAFKPDDNGHKIKYPLAKNPYRNFKYRIVTDGSSHQNAQPKAYIAVSLIAPKEVYTDDEIVLEDELRRLKPWHREREDPYETLRIRMRRQGGNTNKRENH